MKKSVIKNIFFMPKWSGLAVSGYQIFGLIINVRLSSHDPISGHICQDIKTFEPDMANSFC
jgi:hypothetical protein